MKNFLCLIFGHKYEESEKTRTCKRCEYEQRLVNYGYSGNGVNLFIDGKVKTILLLPVIDSRS
jgi:hypothetical protein